jgi:hypothetical protein
VSWSGRSTSRRAEASARLQALRSIGYRGRIGADGDPLDGAGTGLRAFSVGARHADDDDREELDREALEDLADARQWIDGGCQSIAGDGLEDPNVAWPRGYHWHRGDR